MLTTQTVVKGAAKPAPRLVRYWTGDARFDSHMVRIEWVDADGETRTTCGRYFSDDHVVRWDYDDAPRAIDDVACECAASAGEWSVFGVEYAGEETYAQMSAAVEGREAA